MAPQVRANSANRRLRVVLVLIVPVFGTGAILAACADRRPLSDIERAIWATDVPDVIPRPPEIQALAGKPGHPDYERPRAKGRTVLRFIPLRADAPAAGEALRARGFSVSIEPETGAPPVNWMSAEKTWCTAWKCCVTDIGLQLTGGRVTAAEAYDYEYGRWLRAPTLQDSMFGKARCA
jgi:hypothetical protein